MITIIKGKNIKNTYKYDNDDHFYFVRRWQSDIDSDIIKYFQEQLYHESFTNIKTITEFVSYETYASLDNLGYRLNIGEEYEGDIIEKVEGTEDGNIIYYTSKILSIDENIEEKEKLRDELNKMIQMLEIKLEEAIVEKDKKKWYQFWK